MKRSRAIREVPAGRHLQQPRPRQRWPRFGRSLSPR